MEYKFRGLNRNSNEWKYGCLIITEQYTQIWQEGDVPVPVDPQTVGMFIGRKDINGKEVFEDDIVGFDEGKRPGKQTNFERWLIRKLGKWDCTCDDYYCSQYGIGFSVEGYIGYYRESGEIDKYKQITTVLNIQEKCKVLGNIHQNPELLK